MAEQHPGMLRFFTNQFHFPFIGLGKVHDILHQAVFFTDCTSDFHEFLMLSMSSRDMTPIRQIMTQEPGCRETNSPLLDSLTHNFSHLALFFICRLVRDTTITHHVKSQCAVSYQPSHIDCRLEILQLIKVFAVVFPVPRQAIEDRVTGNILDCFHHAGQQLTVSRPDRRKSYATVSKQRRRYPVPAYGGQHRIPAYLCVKVRMNVDEARCHDMPFRVNLRSARCRHLANGNNRITFDSHVCLDGLSPRSINDQTISDY